MKMTKIAWVVASALAISACGDDKPAETDFQPLVPADVINTTLENPTIDSAKAVFGPDLGLHDPSVIKDGDMYYIFGTHLVAAKSSDLVTWEYFSTPGDIEVAVNPDFVAPDGSIIQEIAQPDGADPIQPDATVTTVQNVDNTPLYEDYHTQWADGIAWNDGYTVNWASNVVANPTGDGFYFFNNSCGGNEYDEAFTPDDVTDDALYTNTCWRRSYIGVAKSDTIEGPYTDGQETLFSGYRTDAEYALHPNATVSADNPYDGGVHPNTIDPTAFYDKEGGMWMVYGSHSGGIWMVELDPATGEPKPGQGYGTHLVGGEYRTNEGPFVLYSPETDYYYLMWSAGGFAAYEGYNVRMARSKTPNGPYLDANGVDVSTIKGTNEIGVKLIGSFEYKETAGHSNLENSESGKAWGYNAPGHNSALYEEETGKHFLVFHTRFNTTSTAYPDNAEAHAVRTHEMFATSDGWLLASPQRYVDAPIDGDNVVDFMDVAGMYKFINHSNDTNGEPHESIAINLRTDSSITGDETGTWEYVDENTIIVNLASDSYTAVVKWQWDAQAEALTPTFSGVASSGATIWGTKVYDANMSAESMDSIIAAIDIPAELTPAAAETFELPTEGLGGATISWSSSNPYYVSSDGDVFVPTPDRGDQAVTITATVTTANGLTKTASFDTVLIANEPVSFPNDGTMATAVAHYSFDGDLTDSTSLKADAVAVASYGGDATQAEYADGLKGQAVNMTGYGVSLPTGLLNDYTYSVAFWMKPDALTSFTPALFVDTAAGWTSFLPANWAGQLMLWSNYGGWFDGLTEQAATEGEWIHVAYTVDNGDLAIYLDGVKTTATYYFNGSADGAAVQDVLTGNNASFTLGANPWDIPFDGQFDEVVFFDEAISAENVETVIAQTTDPMIAVLASVSISNTEAVKSSFPLTRAGAFNAGVTWTSSNEAFVKPENGVAVVTQPSPLQGDQQVTLTAHITFQSSTGTETATKTFELTVKSKAPAEYSFEGDLTAKDNVVAAAVPGGQQFSSSNATPVYVEGAVGQALQLDGTFGIRLPDNLITDTDYTIAMWLKPKAYTGYTPSFYGGTSSKWISFAPFVDNADAGPAGSFVWAADGGWWSDFSFGTQVFPTDRWTHVAISVQKVGTETHAVVYLNGEESMSSTSYPEHFTHGGTTKWSVGLNYWADTPYNGAIDELKIYYEPQTAEQIAELFAACEASNCGVAE